MEWIEKTALGILWVLLAYLIVFVAVTFQADARCLAAGYAKGRAAWTFQRYCIQMFGGTESVTPLGEVEP